MTDMARKKRTDYPSFSNGTEFMDWLGRNCDRCVKAEHPIVKHKMLTGYANKGRCRVNEEILDSVETDGVTRRVSRIIKGGSCPYIRTEWPRRKRGKARDGEPTLFDGTDED